MMATDSTPKGPDLSAGSLEALQAALVRFLENRNADADLQTILARVATEAREKRIHAEQLLVLLKDVWFGLPQVRQLRDGDPQHTALQRVVTLCIREYYRS